MTQSPNSKPNDYQDIGKLFQLTTETTRKILQCDRVIIYDGSELPQSRVIAESVVPQYISILGKITVDPFLAEEFLERYCHGQALAFDNIQTVNLNQSQLEELERLRIRSLAIAPIIVGKELLAFLVAHQCGETNSAPKPPWNSETINFLIEKAKIAGLALESIAKTEQSQDSQPTQSEEVEGFLGLQVPEQNLGESPLLSEDTPDKEIELKPIAPSAYPQTSLIKQTSSKTVQTQANGNSLTMNQAKKNHSNGIFQPTGQKTILEEQGNKSFANASNRIALETEKENILETTVEEVRQLLDCDRVLVYCLDEDNYGVVVAESIAAGWTRALGKMIDDPCLAVEYMEKYRNGRIRAIDDIRRIDITPCYQEQLEDLEVKGNLVTPIISEDRLFGLLIAHQCSESRHWQEQEISWTAEIAKQVGLMLQYTEIVAENDLEEQKRLVEAQNKWNQHFTDAIQYIRQSLNQEDILKVSVKEVRRILNCDRVVVYSLNQNFRYGIVIAESVAPGWKRALNKEINDPCFDPTYREKYLNGRVRAWNNIYESGMSECYIEQLEKLEVKANLVTPIINEGKLCGLLVAHQCAESRNWQQQEIRWVAQIATQVGFALDNAKLLANAKQLQHQLKNEAKLTRYFTDAVRYIRESLQQEDILEISVEEVRRVLNCDRVVVYSMNRDFRYGTVIAESVAPRWTRALNKEINDPCFEYTYREKYLNGRVRAWSNIYESGMSRCYIEQLEKLEVKANLVTPVISEGKLFGLLVAHQCSDFRDWQQPEIRWVTQIATQVGFALDNADLLVYANELREQVVEEHQWTEYFTDAIQQIRKSIKTGDILKTSVREVRRILRCDRAVIYSMNSDNHGMIVAESVAPGWTRAKGRVIKDPCFEARYLDMYRNGRVRAWSNIYEAGMTRCYIEQLEKLEVKANLVTPIINEGQLFGLLVAHQCNDFRNWQHSEIRWLTQVATQVGFALDNAKLLEQLRSTQTSNQLSHRQHEQTEIFKHQVVEILGENGDTYQSLSQEAMRQYETTIHVLNQTQKVADSFSSIALNVQQIQCKKQQSDLLVQATQDSLERVVNSISHAQSKVQNVGAEFENLSLSCQQLSEIVNSIKDLSKQIVQQSMSMTRLVNRSQTEESCQNSLLDLSDTIFSLMQQLFEVSAKIDPLFANIQNEVKEKTITLDSGTQQLTSGVREFQTVRQKLDRVVNLNQKMNIFIENISQSIKNQTQSSTFAQDSVQEVASIAERISEQSLSITQSFHQLVVLVQKL
ncbi:GAF domain-containing protein (modular protein) [Hyella patelloides LEGE 07179]|uniref:GAF domain-containing protein (Modular protein) n=1 Tax=Hyella patelloides LEGE 07179 TaxID=945734 RepID=A0A563VSI7_9CYAN|nr:GAF domain-containing protein [Hyella patelloides]VEP14259.1 GAF domain-containing protein (modular protein) [Hyella patelloides LEGE 07179]